MAFEDGIDWRPREPAQRGRHKRFADAVMASLAALSEEKDPFFDTLADSWDALFPGLAARPGRIADGKIVLYVRSAPALFAMRPKLAAVKRRLATLPGAPKRIGLLLEIHK